MKRALSLFLSAVICLALFAGAPFSALFARADDENIALGKTVTVSDGSNPYAVPQNLTDGNNATLCSSANFFATEEECQPLSFTVDLDAVYAIDEVSFLTRFDGYNKGCPYDFTIEIWTGEEWVTVVTETDFLTANPLGSGDYDVFTFEAVEGYRIRITATDYGPEFQMIDGVDTPYYYFQLMELKACGEKTGELPPVVERPNIAKYRPVKVSGGENPYGPPEYLTDEDNTTLCSSVAYPACRPVSFTILLDAMYDIDEVSFLTRNIGHNVGNPLDFTIDIWNGEKWVNVVTETDFLTANPLGSGEYDVFSFEPVNGSRIRITATKYTPEGTDYYFQLMEMKAAGTKTGELPEIKTPSGRTNIAEYMPVTVSDGANEKGLPGSLTDGDTTTACLSGGSYDICVPLAFTIDLDAMYAIDEVSFLTGGAGAPKNFRIDIWNGEKWICVASETDFVTAGGENRYDVFTFKAVEGCRVRLVATSYDADAAAEAGHSLKLMEMMIAGEKTGELPADSAGPEPVNVAAGKPVTVSDGENEYGPPEHLTDGDESTFCSSKEGYADYGPLSFTIDLEGTYTIGEVSFLTRNIGYTVGNPLDFTIDIWDGKVWNTVVARKDYVTANHAGGNVYDVFTFPEMTGSRVRITATRYTPDDGEKLPMLQLMEMRVMTGDAVEGIPETGRTFSVVPPLVAGAVAMLAVLLSAGPLYTRIKRRAR